MTNCQTSEFSDVYQKLHDEGWFVVKLPDPQPVEFIRSLLLEELKRLTERPDITLEKYHEVVPDDNVHSQWQYRLTQLFREKELAKMIIEAQLSFFKELLGPDIKVQKRSYLRITRPGKPQDNIGFHRDTFYGNSPFELSALVPFVNLPAECALSLVPGSHIRPDSDFPYIQTKSSSVERGSEKHQMGFLYAPKLIESDSIPDAQPIPLKIGEMLIFSQSIVHGSLVNSGQTSRWSSDIRVMNSLAPVDLSARPDYYEELCSSPVTKQARAYFAASHSPMPATV